MFNIIKTIKINQFFILKNTLKIYNRNFGVFDNLKTKVTNKIEESNQEKQRI